MSEKHDKIFSNEEIEVVLQDYALNGTYTSAGKALQRLTGATSVQTANAKYIILKNRYNPEYAHIFNGKQVEFKDLALLVAEKAMRLTDLRLDIALENTRALRSLLMEIGKDDKFTKAQKEELFKKINALQLDKLSELATVGGISYDKHRVANDQSINNSEIKIVTTGGDMSEYGA